MAVNEELLKKVLEEIRPNLQADGGDMEYVGVDDEGVVKLELQGACAGCPMSSLTLSMGIERILKEHVPGVTRVEQVNASGETDDLYDEYAPFLDTKAADGILRIDVTPKYAAASARPAAAFVCRE